MEGKALIPGGNGTRCLPITTDCASTPLPPLKLGGFFFRREEGPNVAPFTLSHVYTPAPSFFGKASLLLQSDFPDLIISQTPVPLIQARDSPRDTHGTSPIPEEQSSASQRQHLACPSAQQAWLASVVQAAGAQSAYHACCQALQGASKALDVGSKQKRGPEGQRRLCPTSFPSCGHQQTGKSETGRTKVGMSPASSGTQWDRLTSQVKVSI